LLSGVGFLVREAASGDKALALWRDWKPQLIWMDKRMSGLDGLEVTRRIRAEEKSQGARRTPIIALSASALEHERGEILAAGCDDFTAKPFRESMIFDKLREHLGVRYVYDDVIEGASAAGSPSPALESPANGAHVLLVDDDWICREVATEILRANGVGVTSASSGSEALSLLGSTRFDLVLMDLRMPEMGGIEAARRIKANPETARVPIIAMSADRLDEAESLSDTGMDDYVNKPVEPDALVEILRRWLPAHRATTRSAGREA
jgi:two-component system sensor histidine kinase/response regulator